MKHVRGLTMLATAVMLLGFASSPAMARKPSKSKAKQETLYPNSERVAPKLDLTSTRDQKNLNEALDAVNEGDSAKAEPLLQAVITESKSKYAQALALQGVASLKYNDGDYKAAISNLKRALDLGVMPNDTYFQLTYMLAQFEMADEQYQATLDTVAKWRAEGKRETADSYALEGNAQYRLGNYPAAIAAINKAKSLTDKPEPSWDQLLMASYAEAGQSDKAAELAQQRLSEAPDSPEALHNATAILMQAQKYPEAIELMENSRNKGLLQAESDYISLAKLYLITAQENDDPTPNANKAAQVLEEGISKGLIKPTADNYVVQAQAAEMGNKFDKAVDFYQKAAAVATDGEPALRAGRLLLNENKYSSARSMLKDAIQKGVKSTGAAYMLLAESERGLKNKPAAIAAMKQAAQHPETASKAKAWLKQAGAG